MYRYTCYWHDVNKQGKAMFCKNLTNCYAYSNKALKYSIFLYPGLGSNELLGTSVNNVGLFTSR